MRRLSLFIPLWLGLLGLACALQADDGYRLWLRYDPVTEETFAKSYSTAVKQIVFLTPAGTETPTIAAARSELSLGLSGMLGHEVPITLEKSAASSTKLGEGYTLTTAKPSGSGKLVISADRDIGILYGAFDLLRRIQTRQPLDQLQVTSIPKVTHRLLNHWDNLNGTVARGYAGGSLWEWFVLPDYVNPRYRDYARACASVGINGAVLTNVNANAQFLTANMLRKIAALAEVFRPYGIRVYLTARFSAPIEIGGLKTADPLDPTVQSWWKAKADEIYAAIPDFGGFLVKANSEGQPGPQAYGRNHVDGANMLADALAPHGGIVMWRAFVYEAEPGSDRTKQAYAEFVPLDGKFRPNVVIQAKNGPVDFMPREPHHPLFGAMPHTPLGLELQITQEYLGFSTQLCFLGPLFEEVLDTDTLTAGPGSTVGRIVDGSANGHSLSVMDGIANIGNDRNWCGHPLASANWYAFGRLAWDHTLESATLASEWTRMNFGNDARIVDPIVAMLLGSRETVVNYSMPLGLHHIMSEGGHYGPGPWVDGLKRADWNSTYYHRADEKGLGFDRTPTGTNATGLYAPAVAARYNDLATCPENLLLWFHHVPWDHRMKSGKTLWDELCLRYQRGVDEVRAWRRTWASLEGKIDPERFAHVSALLGIQESEAIHWRDACLLYFQTFSKRPLPAGVEPPAHDLEYYRQFRLVPVLGTDGA
ncbi:MAG: alpha-glucuronidase family glycosyl hydrolase [Nibricoccus sp.]